jgi:hypothetical protein
MRWELRFMSHACMHVRNNGSATSGIIAESRYILIRNWFIIILYDE